MLLLAPIAKADQVKKQITIEEAMSWHASLSKEEKKEVQHNLQEYEKLMKKLSELMRSMSEAERKLVVDSYNQYIRKKNR